MQRHGKISGTPDAVCIGLRDRSTTTPGKRSILDNEPLGINSPGAFSVPVKMSLEAFCSQGFAIYGGVVMKVKCISCRFAVIDAAASHKGWTAYKCGNPRSEYHRALINISPEGKRHKRISWSGCELGERRVKLSAQKTIKALSLSRMSRVNRGQVLPQAHERIQPAVQPGRKAKVFEEAL